MKQELLSANCVDIIKPVTAAIISKILVGLIDAHLLFANCVVLLSFFLIFNLFATPSILRELLQKFKLR